MPIKPAVEIDDASYVLLDEICFRLCAAWPLVPPSFAAPAESLYDLACYISRLAHCTDDEAMRRVELMRKLNILRPNGKVDPLVMKRLRRAGAQRMGVEDEVVPPTTVSPEPEDEGGENE